MNINSKYFQSDDLMLSNPFDPEIIPKNNTDNNQKITNALIFKNHTFIINTIHRNFHINDHELGDSDESLFNIQLKLNPSASIKEKIPVYENNPTLPQNLQQRNLGIYGDRNPYYDPKTVKGGIVAYDNILFSGEKGCKIRNSYRNIIEFNLKSIEISNRLIEYLNPSLQSLIVSIPELSGFYQIHTSDGNDENVTFVLEPVNTSLTSTIYKNDTIIKFPVPTNQLNKLNIKIKYPFQSDNVNVDVLKLNHVQLLRNEFGNIIELYASGNSVLFDTTTKIQFENVTFGYENNNDTNNDKSIKLFLNALVTSRQLFMIHEVSTQNLEFTVLKFKYENVFEKLTNDTKNISDIFASLSLNESTKEYLPNNISSTGLNIIPKLININLQMQLSFELRTKENI
jgi:hypothetical protein